MYRIAAAWALPELNAIMVVWYQYAYTGAQVAPRLALLVTARTVSGQLCNKSINKFTALAAVTEIAIQNIDVLCCTPLQ